MSVVCCQDHNHSLGKHIDSVLEYVATFDASWLLNLVPGFANCVALLASRPNAAAGNHRQGGYLLCHRSFQTALGSFECMVSFRFVLPCLSLIW